MTRTSWPVVTRSFAMNTPTLPAPAIATRISRRLPIRCAACSSSSAVHLGDEHEHVALLADEVGGDDLRLAEPRHRGEPEPAGPVELGELLADGLGRDRCARRGRCARSGRPSRGSSRRGGAGAAPGRWSTRRSRRSGCRAVGRSMPGAGRRCGRRRARCRRSPGRCVRRGCSSCRRSSQRRKRRPRSIPACAR